MSLIRRIMTVSGFTLLSRIFGLIRDLMMARYLGVGMASDAFVIAFKLPNFFRRLFAEGAFSVGFVPLFSKALGKEITPESQKAAEAFASQVLGWLLPVLAIMLLIMEAAMVPVMLGLTGGFTEDGAEGIEKFNLVVEVGALHFSLPFIDFTGFVFCRHAQCGRAICSSCLCACFTQYCNDFGTTVFS